MKLILSILLMMFLMTSCGTLEAPKIQSLYQKGLVGGVLYAKEPVYSKRETIYYDVAVKAPDNNVYNVRITAYEANKFSLGDTIK
jgi:hypothetical protein